MFSLIEDMPYEDTMTIKRISKNVNGEIITDEFGNVLYDIVYQGECDYQLNPSQTKIGGEMYVTEPTVFFPLTDIELRQDDIVDVTTFYNREIKGLIRDYKKDNFLTVHQTTIYLRIIQDVEK